MSDKLTMVVRLPSLLHAMLQYDDEILVSSL